MENKTFIILIVTIAITQIGGAFLTNALSGPKDIATIKEQVRGIAGDVSEIKVDLDEFVEVREFELLDDRLKSLKDRSELVQERLYQSTLNNQEAIRVNAQAIKDLLRQMESS